MPLRPRSHEQRLREQRPECVPSRHDQDHARRRADEVQREADRLRGSGRWKQFRAHFLARYPLCAPCSRRGVIRAAEQVDHVVPLKALIERGEPERCFDEDGCEGICRPCHATKSAAERRARR